MKQILDTNVLVRYFIGDEPKQEEQAKRWFKEAEGGKRDIVVSPVVIAEACFVMEKRYNITKKNIANVMEVLLGQRWLTVIDKNIIEAVWPYYMEGLHFVDSYLLVLAKQEQGEVLSFDKELLRKFKL